jgi:Protein of unknown function (DUF1761)
MRRVHYGAVVVSGIVFWLIQAGWYTVFGQKWIDAIGMTPEQVAEAKAHPSPVPYITALVANLVIAYVISMVMLYTGEASPKRGALTGFVMWMGFVATVLATEYSFEQRPFSLFAIDAGCTLVGMIVAGAIVGAWRKRA